MTTPRAPGAPLLPRGAVAEPARSLRYHTGTWRQERPAHHWRPAPCRAACPAGEDPQAYLAHLQDGNARRAWEVLAAANPLPALTGRVCPHPCETRCNRGRFDEAVAIHSVERELGDLALRSGWPLPVPDCDPSTSEVAVVGGGPAGLSAAYQLVRLGHRVTLFEA